ncbi:MAG: MBOAT family O-acyltransferase [Clostridium sp.]
MIFSSLIFIFKFLPITLLLYYFSPQKYRTLVLTVCSLFFYAWGEPKYIILMIISILVNYLSAIFILKYNNKRKFILFLNIFFNIGVLFIFKYLNFIIGSINDIFSISLNVVNLTLPLGISFYTFQTMSYTVDVYNGKVTAEKNIFNFSAYVCLFPQLIAGPIVKYIDITTELKQPKINTIMLRDGVELFILGLCKKVLLANNIGLLWDEISKDSLYVDSAPFAWLGIIAFSLQIYFDFSGYSTMAIGLGKMLGFNFPENFDFPYTSRSITEFWRRWHITLGSWFKEYLYIPLGGNRVNSRRKMYNLLLVWFLTGFWHGADYNFILWGLYFFTILYFEKKYLLEFLKNNKFISHVYTLILLALGWSIFAITDLGEMLVYCKNLFSFNFDNLAYLYYLNNYFIILVICIFFSSSYGELLYRIIKKYSLLYNVILLVLFIVTICYLVDSTYNPFLYFRF